MGEKIGQTFLSLRYLWETNQIRPEDKKLAQLLMKHNIDRILFNHYVKRIMAVSTQELEQVLT
jgi:hypothetical protein